ncbi:SDR family NAD(P)-dependent oxidoreductase [Nocardiopsis sp. CNT-189]|uniref:SDR family NAD(P)-dependent oxidoreductase n=1 Tax=Nocardiopsis oceanisediminis TaxID=2816862 RepID=UPI003B33A4D7
MTAPGGAEQGSTGTADARHLFRGRTAVITGASSGIGAGFARHAAALGMRLVPTDVAADRLAALAEELAAGGAEVEPVPADVTDPAAVEAVAVRADERFGGADMLVNNAGIMAMGYSWEIPAETWDAALRINVGGTANGLRAFVPRMLDRGTRAWIVDVSSVGGLLPAPLMAPYSATKFAVLALTESLKYELDMRGAPIQVSVVTPGSVKSDIFRAASGAAGAAPEAERFGALLHERAENSGLTAEEHARRVFDQVAEGRYWVVPQPEQLDPGLQPRTDMILERAEPRLPFEI